MVIEVQAEAADGVGQGGADGAGGDSGPMPGARLHRKGVMVNGSGPEWSQYHGQGYGAG